MIRLENMSLAFGARSIFRGLSWRVGDLDRVGLVGPNGSGKTTLLRLLKGDVHPDAGEILTSKGTTYGYLPQEELTLSGRTLFDEVMTVFASLSQIEARMRELEHEMAELPPEGPEHDRVLSEYASLQHEFDVNDGFTIETRVAEVLSGLGFSDRDHGRATEEFSGGWQMRIALAKLLLGQPTVLLLDEPTNHLDLESIIWLEAYLASYPGAVILVSHDRVFLDKVVSRISEVGTGGVVDYYGGYTVYREQREKRRETLAATRRQQEIRIAQIQRFIDKSRTDKFKAALVQSRMKTLEKIEADLVEVPKDTKPIHFEFPKPPRGGSVTIALRHVKQAYGRHVVYDGVDLDVGRGDRIAIVGVNGAGKSTLLRIMAGLVPIQAGERKLGHNVALTYFGQDPGKTLSKTRTILQEIESVSPDDMRPRLRSLLGAFLFSGDDVEKNVGILSGGEKSRLAIAKMLLRPANFLLLDEPTNHLDVTAREVLEGALAGYDGTICLVSHDRFFMDRIASKVLEVKDGRLRLYHGNYTDYLWTKERESAEAIAEAGAGAARVTAAPAGGELLPAGGPGAPADAASARRGPKSKEQKRREAHEREKRSGSKTKVREARRTVQDEITKSEKRLEEIAISLMDPSIYQDGGRVKRLVTEQRTLQAKVDKLYEKWAELEG
jgi:ATP-binding cassette subfamily F protein 3